MTNSLFRIAKALVLAIWLAGATSAMAYPPAPDITPRARGKKSAEVELPQRNWAMDSLRASQWQELGYRGKGFRIAILDSSFSGYEPLCGKTLPQHVIVKSFRKDGNLESRGNNHGTQCAEVIHAIVPEAELMLINWEPDSPKRFIDAVRWARVHGARVISCSVIVPSWSDGEGGGVVHRDLARVLGAGDGAKDLLFFASAGNTAQRHWSGDFRAPDGTWHEWSRGKKVNKITPWGEERISVELASPAGGRYSMFVVDLKTGKVMSKARRVAESDRFCLAVRFLPEEGHTYGVSVKQIEPSPYGFHLSILGGNLERATREGSICFPGDGENVVAVGAVDGDGKRQIYSSCGPNSQSPKPDLMAVVPFPIEKRKEAFTGTSAAAPQAAGAAALLWSRHPEWSPAQVRSTLRRTAVQIDGIKGHSYYTGFGIVRLPELSKPVQTEESSEEDD